MSTDKNIIIRQEVQDLVALAQHRDPLGRETLYNNISSLFEREGRNLSESERSLMADILRRLTTSVDVAIRQKLAQRLAGKADAPHELILLLANDEIEIAHPVIQASHVLEDRDLIRIVYHKTRQHQMSIASRRMVSEPVSKALIKIGNDPVIVALLANKTARIARDDIAELVDHSQEKTAFQQPLVERSDLPPDLAKKMYQWVSDALRETIVRNFRIAPAFVDENLKGIVEELQDEDEARPGKVEQTRKLIDKLYSAGQLKPSFILKCLHQHDIELFEQSFAKLVNLHVDVMRKILYGRGSDGLAIACRAVGIDRSVFLTIFKLTREAQQMPNNIAEEELAHAFSFFQNMDQRKAELTIHRWAAEESRAPIF